MLARVLFAKKSLEKELAVISRAAELP